LRFDAQHWSRHTRNWGSRTNRTRTEVIELIAPVHLDHRLRYARPGYTELPNNQDLETPYKEVNQSIASTPTRSLPRDSAYMAYQSGSIVLKTSDVQSRNDRREIAIVNVEFEGFGEEKKLTRRSSLRTSRQEPRTRWL
jgi:hypothetical protein